MQGTDRKYLGLLPIPLFIAIIAMLRLTVSPVVFYDPTWLVPVTNILFITLVCLAVALIAGRSFLATGRLQILLLGCGVLLFGLAAAAAALVRGLPGGANLNVTIYKEVGTGSTSRAKLSEALEGAVQDRQDASANPGES